MGLLLGHSISDPWSLHCLLSMLPTQVGSAPSWGSLEVRPFVQPCGSLAGAG